MKDQGFSISYDFSQDLQDITVLIVKGIKYYSFVIDLYTKPRDVLDQIILGIKNVDT